MNSTAFIIRVYRVVLRLYPLEFRSEYEDEMLAVFALHIQDKAGDGLARYSLACLQNIVDLIRNVFPEYLSVWGKEFPMENTMLSTKFRNHLSLWGCLCFGGIAIFQSIFRDLTGYSTLPYNEYIFPTFVLISLSGLIFTGLATGLFWMGLPPEKGSKKGKWSFLWPVVACVVLSIGLVLISKNFVYPQLVYNRVIMYIWPFFQTILWGITFGGFFGWAYQGRQGVVRFAVIGAIGEALGYVAWQSSMILTYGVFHIGVDLPSFLRMNPWFWVWNLVLGIIGRAVFGALIGWGVDRGKRGEELAAAPTV